MSRFHPSKFVLCLLFSLCSLLSKSFVLGDDGIFINDMQNNLIQDLMIVNYWDQRIKDHLPVTYDHLLQGGYFNMPSARMGEEGELALGYASVPPYRIYNFRCQLIDRLELTLNYRIFKGIKDPVLGHMGFGDYSDKGLNFKLALFTAEDSQYELPGVAIGSEDLLGTRGFKAHYIALTKVFNRYNFEITLGYGSHRIRGFFGGFSWMPFRQASPKWKYLKSLSFVMEYDATPYQDPEIEKHPKGRVKKTSINFGLKYRFAENLDFSVAFIRGNALAITASGFFNLGHTKGFLPKISDPLPYQAPMNLEPIGDLRPPDVFVQDYALALVNQGFELTEMWLGFHDGLKTLRLTVINLCYREELQVRNRLNALLSSITPDDIDKVIVTLEVDGVRIQEYHYRTDFLRGYREQDIGRYELDILTPIFEAQKPNSYEYQLLFLRKKERFNVEVLPKTQTLFGSARGKFKYALGLSLNMNGFLPHNLYYSVSFGYFILSDLHDVNDYDRLNPSQIINVRTDIINYFKQKTVTIDEAYFKKIWNMGKGFYSALSLGLFEQPYGGIATEFLYYPVGSAWAVGIEGAILKKRELTGIGFTNKIRKLEGFRPTYLRFTGSQYFLNLYYDWRAINLDFKFSAGKFLANDYGVRSEISRYFPSGLRISFWYTYTNGHDVINGQTYHDQGVYFSMPLDIFYTHSSRSKWGYGMSTWLRDVGYRAFTGCDLYWLINEQRQ